MRALRVVAVLLLVMGAKPASAQIPDLKPFELPVVQYDPNKIYQQQYNMANQKIAELGEKAVGWTTTWLIVGLVAAALVICAGIVAYLGKARTTNNPMQLALSDPWIRAKVAAMTDEERADFFGQKRLS